MPDSDLVQLLGRCLESRKGSEWEPFIRQIHPSVVAGVISTLARVGISSRQVVEDLVQETFLKLCAQDSRVLRSFQAGDSNGLKAYIRVIASSTTLDFLRARDAQKRIKTPISLEGGTFEILSSHNPEAEAGRKQLLEHIDSCLADQKDRDRRIFWLYHRQGFTPKAIADLPGIALATGGVETIVYRLTRAVRECLERAHVIPPSVYAKEAGRD